MKAVFIVPFISFFRLGINICSVVLPSAGELHAFSDSLIAMQQEGTEDMETSADSLYARNLACLLYTSRCV